MRPRLLMSKSIELRCADFIETLAVVEVLGSFGEAVTRRGVLRGARQDLILSFGNHRRQQIIRYDNTRFVMDVEAKVHVWKVCNEVLHHAGGGLLLPLVAITDRHHFAVSYSHSNESTVFMADGILDAGPYCFWLECPEWQQHLVDHVKLVNHDDVTPLRKLEPLVEMRRRRNAIPAPILANGLVQRLGLPLESVLKFGFSSVDQLCCGMAAIQVDGNRGERFG